MIVAAMQIVEKKVRARRSKRVAIREAWRAGGFLLQGEMHALMTAVPLRMSRLDALGCDAEAQPPDRKFGEIEEGVGTGEGNAIIRADGFRQAALLKSRSKAMTAGSSRVGIDTSPKREKCHPCVRYKLSPMSRAAHLGQFRGPPPSHQFPVVNQRLTFPHASAKVAWHSRL